MKKPNVKELMINHGEKIAFGVFALIVVVVLAQTSWARFPKSPDELKQKADEAQNKYKSPNNVWPKDKEESFKVVDFSAKANQLFAPVSFSRYEFTPPLFHPLYRKNEPRREPSYEPVMYLTAKPGLAAISVASAPLESTEEMEGPSTETGPADVGGEFSDRSAAGPAGGTLVPGGAAAPPGTMGAGRGAPPGSSIGGKAADKDKKSGNSKKLNPTLGGDIGSLMNSMNAGVMGASGSSGGMPGMAGMGEVKARGVRFMAVRGVFPLRRQVDNYKKALHLLQPEAANRVEISDFVLERQMAMPGEDPWKDAEWKVVDISRAEEVLVECSSLDDQDPVPIALQDNVITMGLPLRLIGIWGDYATHPSIKGLELDDEAKKAEEKLLSALDSAYSEANLAADPAARKGGFAKVQRDVKKMARSVSSNSGSMDMYRQMMGSMGGPGGGMPGAGAAAAAAARPNMGGYGAAPQYPNMGGAGRGPGMGAAGMMGGAMMGGMMRPGSIEQLVDTPKYVLFRYLDFDVESDRAYRYRVRLKFSNPNYQLSADELADADPEIANGEFRESPWSNISNPEVVPSTVNYFLTKVDRDPYNDEKIKSIVGKPVAQVNMFDWSTDLGTVVNDIVDVPLVGGFIGEKKKETLVLNLVEGTLSKEKDRAFTSRDALIDVSPDVEVVPEQHPDLKLHASDKKRTARLGLLQEALIVTSLGELRMLDPISEKSKEDYWANRKKQERNNYEEGAAPRTNSRLAGVMQDDAADSDPKNKGKKKKDVRRNNPMDMMRMMSAPGGAAGGGYGSAPAYPGGRGGAGTVPGVPSGPGYGSAPPYPGAKKSSKK